MGRTPSRWRAVVSSSWPACVPGAPLAPLAAREVRDVFERLGPTYVKLGQLIASSPGVFTPLLSREFESLLDRVAPAPGAAIEKVLTDELGAPPSEVFAEFDATPIASASIAQVHTATLHSGERVVVKVQRPGIAPRLAADVQILTHLARLAEVSEYGRMLSARDVVDDFAAGLNAESISATRPRPWRTSSPVSPDRTRRPCARAARAP